MVLLLEWLRPLVNTEPWDYCVIWKLGDDPSRFIEWGACCCGGGNRGEDIIRIKGENDLESCLGGECRDKVIKHMIRTKACKKLALLPSVIPLYSGIHGDVVISKQPKWTVHTDPSVSVSDDEPNGTQVLIPVASGLIELFSTEHVPKDQKIIDYISARFEISPKQENMNLQKPNADFNLKEQLPDPPRSKDYLENCLPSLHYLNNYLPKIPQPKNYSSFEGSSTCSSLSNEHQLLKIGPDHVFCSISPEKSSKEYIDSPSSNLRLLKRKKYTTDYEFTLGKESVSARIRQKGEKGIYKSKNLVTERNRRKRIKDGMFALRSIVPKISKMDRASTLGDAAEYIKELQETIDNYHDELREMEENDRKKVNAKPDQTKLTKKVEKPPIEVQVEVSQLGEKDFLLKVICKKTRDGFSKFVEALDSLGLRVTDANVTTLNGSVLNVLRVEANRTEVEANDLKHSLVQMVG
ncbi:transcription factor bhlh90 [Phtheirospermum japonicum]|uniref:Transcription factor bhlh90 n=1 Tax=Phtheirospermum japonicum TaxID=374723 RepID=A0A830C4V6_9LAMI|nr:transcription factor bhlh90 [Phtheirospermum japonicum]